MGSAAASLGSPVVLARTLQEAREAGMDETSLLKIRGDEPWDERPRLWSRIMRAIRIDGFPIRVAQRYSAGEIGPLGLTAQVAPDLRSAFERLLQHQHVLAGTVLSRMRDDVERGITIFEILPVEGGDLGGRCRREMMIATGIQFARDITGVRVRPRRVCFRHAEPNDPREHEEFFDAEIRFDADYDGLEFDRDTLAIPLPGADADLSQFLVAHLRALAGDPPAAAATLQGLVRQAIGRRLGNSTLAMSALAQELGMSTRTLRRRLLEQQTSYHDILDRVRRELADELLDDPSHKLSEVAFLLGFSDASAFHRAYVRWTGHTPASRRRAWWPAPAGIPARSA
ncbi:MAG TPA: AraC family transcriptional regulator ligand-binding domain-containing protein [Myxococcota bacterium]|nr:AraC family transcriptional regulator ligand-binding domain-containing protein [Myxococcota bacterium]